MKRKIKLPDSTTKANSKKKMLARKLHRKVIILMAMPTPIHAVTAVLDMPHDFHGRVDRADEVIKKCTGNAYVTIAPAVITAAKAKLTAYSTAPTAAQRDAAFPSVHNTCKSFMGLFQEAAINDIANAIVIIESGGFKVKNITIPQKREFKAVNGAISGDAELYAEGGPAGCTHNWKWSTDGVNYQWLRGTSDAHTHHTTGLKAGATVYYIHELSIHDVPQAQSQPFALILN